MSASPDSHCMAAIASPAHTRSVLSVSNDLGFDSAVGGPQVIAHLEKLLKRVPHVVQHRQAQREPADPLLTRKLLVTRLVAR